jgi:hypothetical protein
MSFTTYATLQTAIADFLHRTDLTAVIPDFITLAEARLNGDVVGRSMDTRTTLTTTAGGTTADRLVTLPTDMLEIRRLTLMTNPAVVLNYKTPDQLVQDNAYLTSTSAPNCFTVIAGSIELSPNPDAVYSLELVYKQRIPALSVSNTSNWVLAQSPNAYLYGSLLSAAPYMQDDARTAVWGQLYQQAIDDLNRIDWYSGSTMRVRAR